MARFTPEELQVMPDHVVRYLAPMQCMEEVRAEATRRFVMSQKPGNGDTSAIRVVHVLRTGEPVCPKCGKGLESEGGSVVEAGSWHEGPLYWRCEDDDETWGYA